MNPPQKPSIAFLTAGAAGMFCGSCMRDNTLAAALMKLGCDVHLIPTYTPIRTDEENVSIDKVFFGGINVFLQEKSAFFRHVPPFLDRWLDQPWLINWLASRSMETDARMLGALTVSMLKGEHGHQKKEVGRLVRWLARDARPDLINLSNILIAGCVPAMKRELGVPILVTLQGDDLFLDDLTSPFKEQAFAEIRRIAEEVDGIIVFSQYYAEFMSSYLDIPRAKFHIVPMGLALRDYSRAGTGHATRATNSDPVVGYMARVCPAKGLHLLIEAFLKLRRMPGTDRARLRAAGWLGGGDHEYLESQRQILKNAGLKEGDDGDFHYRGVLDRHQKLEFYQAIDVLSVPTTYHEPKGIFVLESLASGVPVVQPEHGAFPELIKGTGGGKLFRPNDATHLAEMLHHLLTNHDERRTLGSAGRESVFQSYSDQAMAERTLDLYRRFLGPQGNPIAS
ncbi:MAG: glycosyltransferase family 4 protein [Planctomycetota bacterium]